MVLILSTRVARNPDLLHATAGDEVMMMDIEGGRYFGLDPIGRRIWEFIAEPATISDICARMSSEYDVAPDLCQAEILDFLTKLADHRIIDVIDE